MCSRVEFENTVSAAIEHCPPGAVLLASVSGGADSTAMFHALHGALAALKKRGAELPFELRCIHIEHGIRPAAESRGDAEFVRALCRQFGIPCRIVSIASGKIAALAKKRGIGVEAAARLYRRRAWFRCVRQFEAAGRRVRILTAHTADDMLETALMRIFRGSGPSGLAAMPASRGRILRPLITLSRRDVLDYLAEKKLAWREDSTNEDIQFLRNRVRRCLIPQLNEHFPQWRGTIAALAQTQAHAAEFIQNEARNRIQWGGGNAAWGTNCRSTDAGNFFAQPAIIREEALFQGINTLGASGKFKRSNIRRFAEGKVTAVDLGVLKIRKDARQVVISAITEESDFEGFSLLIYAPGSYNLNSRVVVDVCAIKTAHTSTPETAYTEEKGAFLASLPLVVYGENGTVALKTVLPALDEKRYVVRVTPKRGE